QNEAVEAKEIFRRAHLDGLVTEILQRPRVRAEAALQGENSNPVHHQPRWAKCSSGASWASSMPRIAAPSPALISASLRGSCQWVDASTIAFARRGGSSLRKIPLPTKTASAPSAMHRAASAGVAMPPAAKLGTGSLPASATERTKS